jgi:hypothetical protein
MENKIKQINIIYDDNGAIDDINYIFIDGSGEPMTISEFEKDSDTYKKLEILEDILINDISDTDIPDDFDAFHDVILDAFDYNEHIPKEKLIHYWKLLPENIKFTAYEWGAGDTVFRDNAYVWFLQNKHLKI